MTKPMIQIALDQTNLTDAVAVASNVASYVDVIEVGTILAFAEGMKAVSTLRHNHPDHILVCDMKTTDGGAILSRMAFEAGRIGSPCRLPRTSRPLPRVKKWRMS